MKRKNAIPKQKQRVIGYMRVSTVDQDTKKNELDILKFANGKGFTKVEFVSEKVSGMKSWKTRKLAQVVETLQTGDILIVPELSRLGRSLSDVLQVLDQLSKQDVKVYSVKENFQLNGTDMQSKIMRTMFSLFGEIERDIISMRTKEGLAHARSKGKLLGRPVGPGKSKLDEHREDIISMLQQGVTKVVISRKYKVTSATLINYLKRHKIKIVPKY